MAERFVVLSLLLGVLLTACMGDKSGPALSALPTPAQVTSVSQDGESDLFLSALPTPAQVTSVSQDGESDLFLSALPAPKPTVLVPQAGRSDPALSALPVPELRPQVFLPYTGGKRHTIRTSAKKGCAGCTVEQAQALGAQALHNWQPVGGITESVLQIPHVWAPSPWLYRQELRRLATEAGWLLSYSEPDNCSPGGSCHSLEAVVADYPMMEAMCPEPECRLVGPAPIQSNPRWYQEFVDLYELTHGRAPRIDSLQFHCYYTPDTVENCINLLHHYEWVIYAVRAEDLMVTEFGCQVGVDYTVSQCIEANSRFIREMEQSPRVRFYFIYRAQIDACRKYNYGFEDMALFQPDCNRLTPVGLAYAVEPR